MKHTITNNRNKYKYIYPHDNSEKTKNGVQKYFSSTDVDNVDNDKGSAFRTNPDMIVEWISYFLNVDRTEQPWNINPISQKTAYEEIIKRVIANGTYTTQYLNSDYGKDSTLKYEHFRRKIIALLYDN